MLLSSPFKRQSNCRGSDLFDGGLCGWKRFKMDGRDEDGRFWILRHVLRFDALAETKKATSPRSRCSICVCPTVR